MKITSVTNPRVKAAAKLREARSRVCEGQIIIDGVREIGRAIDAGVKVREVFLCAKPCQEFGCDGLLSRLGDEVLRFDVTSAVFSKLAYGERTDGMVAVAEMPQRTLDHLALSERPLVAVLEGIEKPGNIGAVLRSADAAGVSAVIIADGSADLYNPNAIRASLGTIFTVPYCGATTAETIAWLRRHNLAMFAARVDASVDYTAGDFNRSCAILLGSEAEGLSDAWRGKDITPIRLPMHGAADSLNVSATAAVLFYEALRQRR